MTETRKPRKWCLPLTYVGQGGKKKIEKVMAHEIKQSFRFGDKFIVGDVVSWHDWSGVPYRSPWGLRTEYFTLKEAACCEARDDYFMQYLVGSWAWTSPFMDWLAAEDGIDPPTGEALRDVLASMHSLDGSTWQIIRW